MLQAMRGRSVLVVDDDVILASTLRRVLEKGGCQVRVAHGVHEACALLEEEAVDACLIDFCLMDGDGGEVARWAVPAGRTKVAYCITGTASTKTVVDAMRAGFADVIEKPIDLDRLSALIAASGADATTSETIAWKERFAEEIIGEDEQLLEQLRLVESAADTDCTILIGGETGTGKELVARAIHRASPRHDGPFAALNCAAIPEALVEAELFGHAKGAFTGAETSRTGRILAANGGTLFLDEIGDLPLSAQAKLLRVLQDHTLISVGSDRTVEVDVRVVAATHRDLETMVERGEFRADLLFRLTVIQVELPPLRTRKSDILTLARHFIQVTNTKTGRAVTGLDPTAERALLDHAWPGNVRELENTIERAVVIKKTGTLAARDLYLRAKRAPSRSDGGLAALEQTRPLEPPPRGPSGTPAPRAPSYGERPSERGYERPSERGYERPAARAPELAPAEQITAELPPLAPVVALPAPASTADLNLRSALDDVERTYIGMALERAHGNRTEAAALLGLNRTTLVEKMRKLG
jgi:DNA-binding NtrC family response regulator